MIRVLNEDFFLANIKEGDSFRPESYTIVLLYNGSMEVELNGVSGLYEKGHLILVSTSYVYKVVAFSRDIRFFTISIDRSQIRQRMNFNFSRYDAYRLVNEGINKNRIKPSPANFENLIGLTRQLDFYIKDNVAARFKDDIVLSIFSVIVHVLVAELLVGIQPPSGHNARKEELSVQFLELVSLHFIGQKELQYYADQLSVSVKYLSNCVREITHTAPTKFLADALVNHAKVQLLNTSLPINIIAYQLGFSDQYAFGKFFKRHVGKSPRSFKKYNKLVNTI